MLLPGNSRIEIQKHLSKDQLSSLRKSFEAYQQLKSEDRLQIETHVLKATSMKRPAWPVVFAFSGLVLTLILFVLYETSQSKQVWITAQIFSPLIVGSIGFLACYLISPVRLRLILNWHMDFETAFFGIASFLGLLFLLAYIREQQMIYYKPNNLELLIYLTGAAIAPFFEEFFFREYLPSKTGTEPHFAGHALSGFIFAALHLPDSILMFIAYLFCAYFLSASRIQSRGIFMPYTVHALANISILLL